MYRFILIPSNLISSISRQVGVGNMVQIPRNIQRKDPLYIHATYRARVVSANRIPFQTPRSRHIFSIRGRGDKYFAPYRLFTFDSVTATGEYHSFSNVEV